MKKIITLFILLSAVMSGCSKAEEEPKEPAIFTNAVKNTAEASEDIKKIKSSGDVLYGLYSNNFLSSANITSFSNKVPNVEIYSIETDIYSPFPSEFVLKCYSEGKTPLITIKYGTSAPDMAKFASLAGHTNNFRYFSMLRNTKLQRVYRKFHSFLPTYKKIRSKCPNSVELLS